ncbi:MAG: DUF3842 family protein [Nitrospira sp.]|nr:DUF3842 family protein [Nitrospira sp.]
MRICVIDGRGGGLGRLLVAGLQNRLSAPHSVVALGTTVAAAKAMREAGALWVSVGPSAIARTLPSVDVIMGSLNLILPGAMCGEVTPAFAEAILNAKAKKVLLPVNRAHVEIVGTEDFTLDMLIDRSLARVTRFIEAPSRD